jgi:hypothetical protein
MAAFFCLRALAGSSSVYALGFSHELTLTLSSPALDAHSGLHKKNAATQNNKKGTTQ